jgi:hypothetical protein
LDNIPDALGGFVPAARASPWYDSYHVVYTTGTDFLMVNADESKTQAHKMNNRRFSWEILSFIDIMRDFLSVRFFEICLKTDVQVIATWGDATAAGVSRRRTPRSVIIST